MTFWSEYLKINKHLCPVRCRRRHESHLQQQMESAVTADEPVPLKAVSNGSVSTDDVISAGRNGAAVGQDSSVMHMLVNGHNDAAASSANASSDVPRTSL